ncbi:MAG: GtrA family protein [Myxococcota bacterium]
MKENAPADTVRSGAFFRSALVSVLATATDFVVASMLSYAVLHPSAATFVGCGAGGLVAFLVNRGWAFRSQGRKSAELVRFLLVWATSALWNAGGVGWLTHAGVPFAYAWIIVRGLVYSGWNYPLLRWFVFRRAAGAV